MSDTPELFEFRDLRANRDDDLLVRVHDGLFLESFPDPDEQEDVAAWRHRLWEHPLPPEPELHAIVALASADGSVAGFALVEHYRRSGSVLVSYIAVAPDWRRHDLARRLLGRGLDSVRGTAEPKAVFAEIHDPWRMEGVADVIDPAARLQAMTRLGARRVPIDYVQPALGPDQERSDRLLLVAFVRPSVSETLPAEVVREFLREYYEALGVAEPERDPDFARISEQLGEGVVRLDRVRHEMPALEFGKYGVALHFVFDAGETQPSSIEFASFEQDLLLYSYGHGGTPPFHSAVVELPEDASQVRLVLPTSVRFESEGERISLRIETDTGQRGPGEARERTVGVLASRTDFVDSDIDVCHLVLVPTGAPESRLNEYDLVLLSKLWQGGEAFDAANEVRIRRNGDSMSLVEFAASIFGGIDPGSAKLRIGTIQLVTDEPNWPKVFAEIRRACRNPPSDDEKLEELREWMEQPEIKGLGGIIQGLLDFREISYEELVDVFSPLELDDGIIGIHKGTLVSIAEKDRVYDHAARIGISPYLLLPQAMLLHNEEQLDRGLVASNTWKEMHHALAHYLPNVFQYPQERELFVTGTASRGLVEQHDQLITRLAQASAAEDAKVAGRREWADDVRNALLLVLTGIGLRAVVPLAYAVPAFFVAAVIFVAWRRRFRMKLRWSALGAVVLVLAAVGIAALLGVFNGPAGPSLCIVDASPLVVKGDGFKANEPVTFRLARRKLLLTRAGDGGGFMVRLVAAIDTLWDHPVTAIGTGGSSATLKPDSC